MDPNWLSAVSLLGTRGGNGIRVRSYRLPSEFYILRALCSVHVYSHYASGGARARTLPAWWLARKLSKLRENTCLQCVTHLVSLPLPPHPPPPPPSIQLSYRRQRHKEVNTLTTANSTAELTLPEEDDDYTIHIQTLSEGGLGPASDPIRIHQLSELCC